MYDMLFLSVHYRMLKVKSVLKKVGSFSISAITQAAAGVVQADMQKHLGL
jgi:hypothetical protein